MNRATLFSVEVIESLYRLADYDLDDENEDGFDGFDRLDQILVILEENGVINPKST